MVELIQLASLIYAVVLIVTLVLLWVLSGKARVGQGTRFAILVFLSVFWPVSVPMFLWRLIGEAVKQ